MICIAKIVGPHGVHGSVRVLVFSDDPMGLANYKNLKDKNGKDFGIKKIRLLKGEVLVVKFDEIQDRTEAEAARGIELFVSREEMPDLDEDEFYINDLVALSVRSTKGDVLGVVKAVENHGAGYFLTLDTYPKISVPFTKEAVPELHIHEGYIVMNESFLSME